jgi:hypothetical protein
MSEQITRRVLGATVLGGTLAAATEVYGQDTKAQPTPEEERDYPAPKFKPMLKKPRLSQTLVQDFVIFAHSDLDMVKLLLDKYPAVLNATVDWGGGDWESGLGGASHMGRRDIAELLLEKGARIDIFAAAMLGHLDTVKSLLAARPNLIDAKGPHGIPLIVHAKQGGKEAEAVFKFLEALKPAKK